MLKNGASYFRGTAVQQPYFGGKDMNNQNKNQNRTQNQNSNQNTNKTQNTKQNCQDR